MNLFDLCSGYFNYLNQGEVWLNKEGQRVPISSINERYAWNILLFMEKRAAHYAFHYSLGEAIVLSRSLDVVGEMAQDAVEREMEQAQSWRDKNPVDWIRTTTLYNAIQARRSLPKLREYQEEALARILREK